MCTSPTTAGTTPVIYSVTDTVATEFKRQASAIGNEVTSSIKFTDNGSLYLATLHGAAAQGAGGGDSVSVFGVSEVNGAVTSVNAENVRFVQAPGAAGARGEGRFTLRLNMTNPLPSTVDFVFDVNPTAVTLVSATDPEAALVAGVSLATVWCVTKNGGAAILPVLVGSLPALVGGPAAFLAAVVAKLPGALIGTAQSVIRECFA
ncbi:hypothetical protein [Actinosynnema sp. NPDC023587]|uniref:hypothetical protein n=1 Tax=Actinosynnema sp. NPDC023587 TaxID=3154695 RepID=UPI0033D8CA45